MENSQDSLYTRKRIDFDPLKAKAIQAMELPETCKQLKVLLRDYPMLEDSSLLWPSSSSF